MEETFNKAQRLKYTSFAYLDMEEIIDTDPGLTIVEPEVIMMCKIKNEQYRIYWASETKERFLNTLKKVVALIDKKNTYPKDIYLEFIPPDFVPEMKNMGFNIASEFVDYWVNNLQDIKITASKDYKIEKVLPDEYENVYMVTKSCDGYSRGFGFYSEPSEFIKEWAETENSCILNVKMNGEIAGVCFLNIYGFDNVKGPTLWLRELAVSPKYHCRGIAHSLIAEAFKWGIANGAKRSFLACDTENFTASKIYESFGYKRKDEHGQINMIRIQNQL